MSRNLFPKAGLPTVVAEPIKPKFRFDSEHSFRLRRHIGTPEFNSFNNLWELSSLDDKGIAKVLVDADSLAACLDTIGGEFEALGF